VPLVSASCDYFEKGVRRIGNILYEVCGGRKSENSRPIYARTGLMGFFCNQQHDWILAF